MSVKAKKDGTYKKRTLNDRELKPETLMMSYGYDPQWSEGSVKPPVFLTSTFVFDSAEAGEEFFHVVSGRKPAPDDEVGGLVYSRFNHPNVEIVEDRLAVLERSESALVMSSGMGAITATLMAYLRPGDVLAHSTPLYGGTETLIRNFLPQFGIETEELHNSLDRDDILVDLERAQGKGNLKMVLIETPSNPTNTIVDFAALTGAIDDFEKKHGTRPLTACDNTMLGPIFQNVIPHGLDMAIYSLTKYIGGHSDLVAGAVCGSKEALKPIRAIRSSLGLNLDPHSSWMISRSMETLTIRMERAAATGRKVADWIADNGYAKTTVLHPDFTDCPKSKVAYERQCSGPGSTFSFIVDGADRKTMFALINGLQIFKSAVSLGGTESLVCHPASTTHSGLPEDVRAREGIAEGLVRLSIGLEHPDDLIADLSQSFAAVF